MVAGDWAGERECLTIHPPTLLLSTPPPLLLMSSIRSLLLVLCSMLLTSLSAQPIHIFYTPPNLSPEHPTAHHVVVIPCLDHMPPYVRAITTDPYTTIVESAESLLSKPESFVDGPFNGDSLQPIFHIRRVDVVPGHPRLHSVCVAQPPVDPDSKAVCEVLYGPRVDELNRDSVWKMRGAC